VHQRPLGVAGGHAVHPAQQQRVVREQQLRARFDCFLDGLGDRVDRDQHPLHGLVGITADEPDRVPALRECGRVGSLQGGHDVPQRRAHTGTSASAVRSASTSTAATSGGRTATRR
jgi:hypothetical protein